MLKSILINFNGCPSTLDSLMPDNGLANLASSLLSEGHYVVIEDFCTVDIIDRMIPDNFKKELAEIYEESIKITSSGSQFPKSMLSRLVDLDKKLEQHKHFELINIANEIIDKAIQLGVDFIGFKLWTGDGFDGSEKIAKIVKEKLPDVKLIAGGPHVDWFMENIFKYTDAFDILVYGEGEETIKLLADYFGGNRDLDDIPNIIYQKNGHISITPQKRISDLNSLPYPTYSHSVYPAIQGDQKIRFIMIDESRGCPNSCNFCIHPQKSGSKWRKRDYIYTVDLIEKISRELNTHVFRLAGSNTPPELRKEIAQELINRNLGISYAGFGHVRGEEDYEFLKKSGCVSMAFGVESGSQTILDNDINKRVNVNQIANALINCKNADILTVASIIMPCPHDTDETIKETLDLLISTKPHSVTVQLPGLIPNATWYKKREHFGFSIDDNYMTKLMLYRIKLLLPPALWDTLPYKMNGKSSYELSNIAQEFSIELEKNGILTGIGDFLLLIAKSMGISPIDMRNLNRKMFFVGDSNKIRDVLKKFNHLVRNG